MKILSTCLLLTATLLSAQTSFISGFELGTLSEGFGSLNTGSVQSAIVRSGNYAYRANPVASNQTIVFASRSAGGVLRQIFKSSRFYIQVAALPSGGISPSVSIVKLGGAATFNPEVDLGADGTLTLADSTHTNIGHSSNALTVDGLWHRVEFDIGSGLRVYVDGLLWASGGSTSYPAATSISLGAGDSPTFINASTDLYFDDVLVDAGSYGALPGDGSSVLLPASFTSGSRYVTGSYVSSGVPSSAFVNATMAICVDEQTGHGKTNGTIGSTSNPAGSAYSFDFGDGVTSIASTNAGPVSAFPSVDLSSSATIGIIESNSRNQTVSFAGLYVDFR